MPETLSPLAAAIGKLVEGAMNGGPAFDVVGNTHIQISKITYSNHPIRNSIGDIVATGDLIVGVQLDIFNPNNKKAT